MRVVIVYILRYKFNGPMKTTKLLPVLLFFLCQSVVAQNDTIVGILRNIEQKPIKNQTVTLGKIHPKTVKTDKLGIFTIPDANLNDTLYIYIKKEKRELTIPVNGYDVLSLTLRSGAFNVERITRLDPYLVEAREKDRNKMISSNTLNKGQIEKTRCTDVMCLLRHMSGVMVTGGKIQIRGVSSINSSTTPLFVLDGIPMHDLGGISGVPIHTIEEISVLKEATMYGAQGANGAIIVKTTK